jgi:RNA polymerase sigma-70 factor (ECF subfamily)
LAEGGRSALASAALPTWENLEQLYLRYSRSVYRRARELLSDDEAARDATQEVFIRVMRAGGRVPAEPTPTAWLHSVTTNLCLNQLRDRKRQNALLATKYTPSTGVAPVGESRATVLQILTRVPEELQDIAVYFFLDELTYDEIGQLIGVSRRTVSNRLAAFRELVEHQFPNQRLAS